MPSVGPNAPSLSRVNLFNHIPVAMIPCNSDLIGYTQKVIKIYMHSVLYIDT